MKFPSSIFSFSTISEHIRVSKSAIVALVACAAVRLVLCLAEPMLAHFPGGADAREFLSIEKLCVKDTPHSAEVLLIGSSRNRYALVADIVSDELGLEQGMVQNISLRAGGPLDALILIRRNPRMLDNVKVIVFDVNPWQINWNSEVLIPPRFHLLASFSERLSICKNNEERCKMFLDIVWPFVRDRRTLTQWMGGFHRLASGQTDYTTDWNPWWAPGPQGSSCDQAVRRHMKDFSVCPLMSTAWKEFIDLTIERGIPLLLIEIPTQEQYYTLIDERPDYKKGYQKHQDTLAELARRGAHLKSWKFPEDAGLTKVDLFDYGHLTKEAAGRFSRLLARYLVEEGIYKPPMPCGKKDSEEQSAIRTDDRK